MEIAIIGSGYVGLVAGACFAETGNEVVCVDVDEKKIEDLKNGIIPIYEPGLEDMVSSNYKRGLLQFTTNLADAVKKCSVIFIAVGTPQDEDGSADLRHVLSVAEGIGKAMNGPKVIVDKSTVPVGTGKLVKETIQKFTTHRVDVVSNPEFLKEGAAIDDFMKPDRVVVGVDSENAAKVMKELYGPFVRNNHPVIVMDVVSAETTKYAANTMLATRVSFMNEVSQLCEKVGADVNMVRVGIGTDARIGMSFLYPGLGYGGSCFPKDVQAFIFTGKQNGIPMKIATAVEDVNVTQKQLLGKKVVSHFGEDLKGKHFAIWGLAFKPKTDDTREAPALTLFNDLISRGATITTFDPEANETFKARFGENKSVAYVSNHFDALNKADALIICTEWGVFRTPNFIKIKEALKTPVIFDGRNIYDPAEMKDHGITYYSIGRPAVK